MVHWYINRMDKWAIYQTLHRIDSLDALAILKGLSSETMEAQIIPIL